MILTQPVDAKYRVVVSYIYSYKYNTCIIFIFKSVAKKAPVKIYIKPCYPSYPTLFLNMENMIIFMLFLRSIRPDDTIIRFPVIGDWGGYFNEIIFPTGYTIAQEPGAQT